MKTLPAQQDSCAQNASSSFNFQLNIPINLNPQLTEYPKWKISLAKEKTTGRDSRRVWSYKCLLLSYCWGHPSPLSWCNRQVKTAKPFQLKCQKILMVTGILWRALCSMFQRRKHSTERVITYPTVHGKLGKSSTQKCFGKGYVPRRVFHISLPVMSMCNELHFIPSFHLVKMGCLIKPSPFLFLSNWNHHLPPQKINHSNQTVGESIQISY